MRRDVGDEIAGLDLLRQRRPRDVLDAAAAGDRDDLRAPRSTSRVPVPLADVEGAAVGRGAIPPSPAAPSTTSSTWM